MKVKQQKSRTLEKYKNYNIISTNTDIKIKIWTNELTFPFICIRANHCELYPLLFSFKVPDSIVVIYLYWKQPQLSLTAISSPDQFCLIHLLQQTDNLRRRTKYIYIYIHLYIKQNSAVQWQKPPIVCLVDIFIGNSSTAT